MATKKHWFLSTALIALQAASAHAEPFAYVTNSNSNSVSVIDTQTNAVTTTVTVGARPWGVAITPDGAFAYVTNNFGNSVSVIDTATNTVTATVPVGAGPIGIAITPDGAFAYVSNLNSNQVSVIDIATNTVTTTVAVTSPFGIAITPDGAFAYVVGNTQSCTGLPGGCAYRVSAIDTATNTVIAAVPVGATPNGIAITPGGAFAYVANRNSNNISVIDTATNTVTATVPVGVTFPREIVITPDGAFAYVSHDASNKVSVIDTGSNTVTTTVNVGSGPRGIAIAADGAFAYVANETSGGVSVIDTGSNSVTATVTVGFGPEGIAITPPDDNAPPTADAGANQSIRAGSAVMLDGTASFDDNTATAFLSYEWAFLSRPSSSTAALAGASTATPSFWADVAGAYIVELTVTDEGGLTSVPDQVQVSSLNLAPTARAGDDQLVIVSSTVSLDGTDSSDPEHDAITFDWALTVTPVGSVATLSDADSANAHFVPDREGVYEATLRVSDLIGPSQPDTVAITVTSAQAFSEAQLVIACEFVRALPSNSVTTPGNQNAFCNFLSQAVMDIKAGRFVNAASKVSDALIRSDGCALRGEADGSGTSRDWIIECDGQNEVYSILIGVLDALR